MKLELVTAPASEFVDVAEAAFNAKADATYDETKLTRDIYGARLRAEKYCERSFINTVWKMNLDKFPSVNVYNPKAAIYIPKGKIQGLTDNQISYIDEDGDSQTLTLDTDFHMDSVGDVARLVPSESLGSWPATSAYKLNAVTVNFTAGFGTSLSEDKYGDIKNAVLLDIGTLYEQRQSSSPVNVYDLPAYQLLLSSYRIDFDFYFYNDR